MVAAAVAKLNALTAPLERAVVRFRKPISWALLVLSAASVAYLAVPNSIKDTGGLAWNALLLVAFIGPLTRVMGLGLLRAVMVFRKELGVLMGTLALVHAAQFFWDRHFVSPLSGAFWLNGGELTYLAWGVAAIALTVPLWATSNAFSQRLLGRKWKWLHRLAYLVLPLTALHVGLIHHDYVSAAMISGVYAAAKLADVAGVRLGRPAQARPA